MVGGLSSPDGPWPSAVQWRDPPRPHSGAAGERRPPAVETGAARAVPELSRDGIQDLYQPCHSSKRAALHNLAETGAGSSRRARRASRAARACAHRRSRRPRPNGLDTTANPAQHSPRLTKMHGLLMQIELWRRPGAVAPAHPSVGCAHQHRAFDARPVAEGPTPPLASALTREHIFERLRPAFVACKFDADHGDK
jgi:hypothetical protein